MDLRGLFSNPRLTETLERLYAPEPLLRAPSRTRRRQKQVQHRLTVAHSVSYRLRKAGLR